VRGIPPLFQPIAAGQRAEGLRAYLAFLADRNGQPDFERRTLSRREQVMARYHASPVRFRGPIDEELLQRQLERFDRTVATPPELLLLVVYLKLNAAEAYGVDAVSAARHGPGVEPATHEQWVALEETYHTRILNGAARLYGLEVNPRFLPPAALRLLIGTLAHVPQRWFHPVLLASEVVGATSFWRLFRATGEILRDQPELRDALQERVLDVLVDEVGHISYNRLCLGRPGMRLARALVPLLALSTRWFTPEGVPIGVSGFPVAEALSFDPAQLPEEVRRRAFLA
jgi:hypothetical protein